jgi:hypothetical protein
MALTLKDMIELQRRQREERVQAPAAPPKPAPPTVASLQPVSPPVEPRAAASEDVRQPAPQPQVSGLMARLQKANGASAAVAQSHLPTTRPAIVEEKPVISPSPNGTYTADETETLKKNLAFLAANMEEASVIGQVLRGTVKQLQEHPELSSIMIDSDFDLIVAAARRSMKFAVRKKDDRTEKGMKKRSDADELTKWMKDAGFEL